MNADTCLLEEFKNSKPKCYRNLVNLLNEDDNWKTLLVALSQYRINLLRQKVRNVSPAEQLIDELVMRSCTVENLRELLKSCNLTNVVALISDHELLKIIKQPGEEDEVKYLCFDGELSLECHASGIPPPKYQWFHDNVPMENQNKTTLHLKNFSLENEGDYYCEVNQRFGTTLQKLISHTITVYLMDTLPEFIQQPSLKITRKAGSKLNLMVEVDCKSRYSLQWMLGNMILPGETSNTLIIKNLTKHNSGEYRCVAKNSSGEVYTLPSILTVECESFRQKSPSAKIALLIANEKYKNFTNLATPVNDVILLNEKLTQLNFKVITLMNLTLVEMQNTITWFFQLVPQGSYAFFCFVGHGFMLSNNKFMMPVDCPSNAEFRMTDCICDELLIMKAKENKLKLIVSVLDMCLKVPKSEESPHIFEERTPDYIYPSGECHVVKICSTASHQSAYEDPKSEYGIYIQHLSKYLTLDQPMVSNLLLAHQDFANKKLTKVQKPSVSVEGGHEINLKEDACESNDFLAKWELVNKLNNIHELSFSDLGIKTNLYVVPHRKKILNALDLHFSQVLLPWMMRVDVSPEVFNFEKKLYEDGFILTMHGLQKAKSDVFITILLNKYGKRDLAIIDLGIPLFAMAKVWYEPIL